VTLPKPLTSGAKADGRFGKQDFVYLREEDAYRCPAWERLPYRYTTEEDGKILRRYWTTACQTCSLKSQCTPGPERRITSMSTFSRPCSSALMPTRKRYVNVERQSSTRSAR
jgi:hypothetical protein